MSTKLRQIIKIEDSNLANATKTEYGYRLKQFFHDSTIKSFEELIDVPSEELENTLVSYCKFLLVKVTQKTLSANTVPKMFKPIKFVLEVNYRENDVIKIKELSSRHNKGTDYIKARINSNPSEYKNCEIKFKIYSSENPKGKSERVEILKQISPNIFQIKSKKKIFNIGKINFSKNFSSV
ncbi:MAG: hypothetical protein IIB02_09120 [Thaumarchaeota archaeon]|nr:hypothetical protein [Nitrososphaerota archaeon]